MAVYVPPGRRRRLTLAVVLGALVGGIVIGIPIGRGTATSLEDEIATGRSAGRELVTSLRVLPLEYRQAIEGSEGSAQIGDTVGRSRARVPEALGDAPWLGEAQRREVRAAVEAVQAAARSRVPPKRFGQIVERSAQRIEAVFGLPHTAGP